MGKTLYKECTKAAETFEKDGKIGRDGAENLAGLLLVL